MHMIRCALTMLVLIVAPALTHASDALRVRIDTGTVQGFEANGVREFRGIPFAEPPLGTLRWAAPTPPQPWRGVRDATRFGAACPQAARYDVTEASNDEDCLHVNVAVPARHSAAPRPVFVWLYGGAFVGGSSNLYLPERLARDGDMVVVTGNYRVGAFGFLAHPALGADIDGALGIADQRAMLRWVRSNIAAFGGDPGNITIAGESAGAASVCFQLATPALARGLFHRAIIQSLDCTMPLRTREQAWRTGHELAEALGCAGAEDALACLRALPVQRIVDAATTIASAALLTWAPAVGSAQLPRQPGDAFRDGGILPVPIMNGGTRDEMRLYVGYEVAAGARIDASAYANRVRAIYGEHADDVIAAYGPVTDAGAAPALGRLESDFLPGGPLHNCGFLRTAELASRRVPVYQYLFADPAAPAVMPDPGFAMGAVHSAELPYFFPGFSNNTRYDTPPLAPQSQQLSAQMIAWWSAFARTGSPAVAALPSWPRYAGGSTVMRLEPGRTALVDADAEHRCAFWRARYPQELGAGP